MLLKEIKLNINKKVNNYFWKLVYNQPIPTDVYKFEDIFKKIKLIYNRELNKCLFKEEQFIKATEENAKYKIMWEQLKAQSKGMFRNDNDFILRANMDTLEQEILGDSND